MRPFYRLVATSALVYMLSFAAIAQTIAGSDTTAPAGTLVTISATTEGIRITAPNAVVQLRLEVYDELGRKLFDTEQRGGSVLDWNLQDSTGGKIADGRYVCVVTIKTLSGRFSQKMASMEVTGQHPIVRRAEETQLNLHQLQVVGALDEDPNLTIVEAGETAPATLASHTGEEGQLSRTLGAFTFRFGDFLRGQDTEQMRLTEAGDLGLGTTQPQAKLDVAGDIRASGFVQASKGVQFADGTVQVTGLTGRTDSDGNIVPNVAGTGTTNQIAKWTDNAGTLGNSTITEVSGRVGIGAPSPTYKLVVGPDIGPGLTTSDLTVSRGPGQSISAFVGASGANGMNFGWDQTNLRAFVNAPVESPITFTHGGVSERMRIATNGNVGVGTASPGAKLDVGGDINTTTQYNIGGNRVLSVSSNNTFAGLGAGQANAAGGGNAFFGFNAGIANNAGSLNSFFGVLAGTNSTSGGSNSFFGSNTGQFNTDGQRNSFLGSSAGFGNTGGDENTFVGFTAGNTNNTGNNNTIVGAFADVSAGTLTNATALGHRAQVAQNNSLVLGSINGINGATADTRVGIGTTTPTTKLDVHNGEITSSGTTGGRFAANNPNNQSAKVLLDWLNDTPRIRYGGNGVGANNGFEIQGPGDLRKFTISDDGIARVFGTLRADELDISGFKDLGTGHVATISNGSTDVRTDVLRLAIGRTDNPGQENNYITFNKGVFPSALVVGSIQGNGSGGVELAGPGSDYAEWLPRLNRDEEILAGQIVGLFAGGISKMTRGAVHVMAVSTGPIVAGNDPGETRRASYERVAFIGQVMIPVRGPVSAGDFIVASGLNDGSGIAVSPDRIMSEQFEQTVGQAWESSAGPGLKSVRTAVGLLWRDPSVKRLVQFNRQQAEQIASLRAQLTAIESKMKKDLDALRVLVRYSQRAAAGSAAVLPARRGTHARK